MNQKYQDTESEVSGTHMSSGYEAGAVEEKANEEQA